MSERDSPSIERVAPDHLPNPTRKGTNLGWVFLVLLGVQVLVRLVIHFRNPFDISVCDRNSLAVDFVTDPLIWIWAVLAIIRLTKAVKTSDPPRL